MTLVDRIPAAGEGPATRVRIGRANPYCIVHLPVHGRAARADPILLGSPGFPKQLLVELQALMDVRHLAIISFDDQLIAHLAVAESLGRVAVAKAAGRIYERFLFYRYDPNVRVIQGDTESDEPLLLRLRAREITDDEYRTEIFERFTVCLLRLRLGYLGREREHEAGRRHRRAIRPVSRGPTTTQF